MYAKDLYEAKYQLLINKREVVNLNHYNGSKGFVEYPNDMDIIYENIGEYGQSKNCETLIVFYDVIVDIISNKTLQQIVADLEINNKTKSFSCFYYTILLSCTKKY